MSPVTDWISAMCSLCAAIVGLVTLLTVYVAAMQVLSRREQYSLGISTEALGPWVRKVVSPSLLKMQTRISTPKINLPRLVAKDFNPIIKFPIGPSVQGKITNRDLEASLEPSLAKASWVNFLEAIDLQPGNTEHYEMQSEPDLVNGIVPMRWKGSDLVAICSMLGFQSYEEKPSYRNPMPLPMQWSGPLGWLQFRASSDGCIVEFRRRRLLKDRLPQNSHKYYNNLELGFKARGLKERLWQSMGGLYLNDKSLLYLGGADCKEKKTKERSIDTILKSIRNLDTNPTDEELKGLVWGSKGNRPEAVKNESSPMSELKSTTDLLDAIGNTGGGTGDEPKVFLLSPCPGLLSITVEGELMYARGLYGIKCHEYDRTPIDQDEVNKAIYQFRLGHFYMTESSLLHLKQAVLLLQPDGFYFTSGGMLTQDVIRIWEHVGDLFDQTEYKFPAFVLPGDGTAFEYKKQVLHEAMVLCKEFQRNRISGRAQFTISDMRILSKASMSLREITPSGEDLIWAMIVRPPLFAGLARLFRERKMEDVLNSSVECLNDYLECKILKNGSPSLGDRYSVPLLHNGKSFDGTHVLAAFLHVSLTFFWIDKAWPTDVLLYDATMPQTVTMC